MRFNALYWWIDRWRKSTAYTDMSLEEQGAYRNLLDEATLRGGALPKSERILAKACGDATKWKAVRQAVLARFEVREDGLHNRTLDEVLRASATRVERQARYRRRHGLDDGMDDDDEPGDRNEGRNDDRNEGRNEDHNAGRHSGRHLHRNDGHNEGRYPDPDKGSVSGTGSSAPPGPPSGGVARANGSPRSAAQFEQAAAAYIEGKGGRAWRAVRRTLRTWFRAGVTLEEAKARIDRNEHVPPLPP